eukprot:UN20117
MRLPGREKTSKFDYEEICYKGVESDDKTGRCLGSDEK